MPSNENASNAANHYNSDYFNWQKNIGAFGGWANSHKFSGSIRPSDTVIDFGCGGGFLLNNLTCKEKIGIELNPSAAESVRQLGVRHFYTATDAVQAMGEEVADVIISNHALEHTHNPLQELKNLRPLLKKGGIIHFFIPCDTAAQAYKPKDINNHLYSWSPMNFGNLFVEAGYEVDYMRPFIHKWPPHYTRFAKLGWPIFDLCCKVYGRIERSYFQVEGRSRRPLV